MGNIQARKYRDSKFWSAHVEKWQNSGLTQAEYCRQNNLREKSLTYWKGKMARTSEEIRFVPVPFVNPPPVSKGSAIKVLVSERYVIEVVDGFTPSTLKQIIRVLEVE